jgi:hypothetical protein
VALSGTGSLRRSNRELGTSLGFMRLKTHGIKFNLMVRADCEPTSTSHNDGQNMKMHAQRKDRRGDLIPAIVTLIVAVVGTAGILLNDFGPASSQAIGNARMITAAAVSRAGAIEIPSEPPAGGG